MNERRYYSEEAKMEAQRERGLLVLLMLGLGLGVGAALALLFAPKAGEDIREDLSHVFDRRMGGLEKQVNDLRNRIEDRISNLT